MSKQFTLGKNERLKSRKLIDQLFSEGKSFAIGFFRVYYLINDSSDTSSQFGAGAGSKNFKKAVDRNRIKRLMREAWRLQKLPVNDRSEKQNKKLSVFFIYTGKELPEYKDVYDKTGKAIEKLCKLITTK